MGLTSEQYDHFADDYNYLDQLKIWRSLALSVLHDPICRFTRLYQIRLVALKSSLTRLLIAMVEDGFCVRLLGQQDVIENPCDFMRGGSDGLGRAQLDSHAPKELNKVTLRAAEGVGTHPECSRGAMLYLGGLQDNISPPLTRFSGQRPSHEAKVEALRNRLTSLPISVRMTCAVAALTPEMSVRSTPQCGKAHRHHGSRTRLAQQRPAISQKQATQQVRFTTGYSQQQLTVTL